MAVPSQQIQAFPVAQGPRLEDLPVAATLVPAFEAIRGYAAANAHGITRDESILEELAKLLHAKIHDELRAAEGRPMRFFAGESESPTEVAARLRSLYREAALTREDGRPDEILFDDAACFFGVRQLEGYRVVGAERDVVGEAYEALIFPALRGGQGQFFTPRNVAACMVQLLDIQPGEKVIDPAVGTGGFLAEAAPNLLGGVSGKGLKDGELVGIDKDALLARMAQDSLAFRFGVGTIACANSLLPAVLQPERLQPLLRHGAYDVAITNPPFGAKIPVTGEETLKAYDLAYEWKYSKSEGKWRKTSRLRDSVAPQILFIELCYQLLREGGRCAIVLPEGVAGNESAGYVRDWLLERTDLLAVVDCPLETFMPSTSTKTVILVFQKTSTPTRPPVFMAVAERCGHDRRGKPIFRNGRPDDDFPEIVASYKALRG